MLHLGTRGTCLVIFGKRRSTSNSSAMFSGQQYRARSFFANVLFSGQNGSSTENAVFFPWKRARTNQHVDAMQ